MDNSSNSIGLCKKESQVDTQLETLTQAIEIINKSISELENRLDRVLRPSAPSTNEKCAEAPTLVGLAETIASRTNRINSCRFTVDSILQRLEL